MKLSVLWSVALAAFCGFGATEARLGGDGRITLPALGVEMGVKIHAEGWKGSLDVQPQPTRRFPDAQKGLAQWRGLASRKADAAQFAHGTVTLRAAADDAAAVAAVVVSDADQRPEAVVWSVELPADRFGGGTWAADAKAGELPCARPRPRGRRPSRLHGGDRAALGRPALRSRGPGALTIQPFNHT